MLNEGTVTILQYVAVESSDLQIKSNLSQTETKIPWSESLITNNCEKAPEAEVVEVKSKPSSGRRRRRREEPPERKNRTVHCPLVRLFTLFPEPGNRWERKPKDPK
jgi:hypothetical protein